MARLQGEVIKRGVVDVLRNGIRHGPHHIELFYGTPSPGNEQARVPYEQNRFTVTRQLRYSRDETQRTLDIGLFINGLPFFTFELKNRLTKQTVYDAIEQYRRDRNPRVISVDVLRKFFPACQIHENTLLLSRFHSARRAERRGATCGQKAYSRIARRLCRTGQRWKEWWGGNIFLSYPYPRKGLRTTSTGGRP